MIVIKVSGKRGWELWSYLVKFHGNDTIGQILEEKK